MADHDEVARPELARMVRGRGRFLDDTKLQGMCYAAFVRSEYAHANIVSIDVSAAMEVPGAVGVILPDEILPHVNPVRPAAPGSSEYARPYDRYPVPPGKVTYVGDPIVAVAAETPHAAQDMAEAVLVEYEPLPVVGGAEQAMAPNTPVIHEGMNDNIVFHRQFGDGDVDGAFSRASLVLDKTFNFPRQTGVPLEPRGVIASYDSGQERLTIWASCRSPHLVKTTVSNVMRLPQHSVRVISGDVGGEFGIKGAAYPESIILSFLSRKVDRPVKWVEDRMESLLACGHAHEMAVDVSVAANNEGRVLGVKARVLVDQGAHTLGPTSAGLEPMTAGQSIVGPYRIDNFSCESYGLLTNKCPGAAYRGVGTVQGVFVIERVMDMLAEELGLDPADVRMTNFIQPQDQPFHTSADRLYDSGDYPDTLPSCSRSQTTSGCARNRSGRGNAARWWASASAASSSTPAPVRRTTSSEACTAFGFRLGHHPRGRGGQHTGGRQRQVHRPEPRQCIRNPGGAGDRGAIRDRQDTGGRHRRHTLRLRHRGESQRRQHRGCHQAGSRRHPAEGDGDCTFLPGNRERGIADLERADL